MNTIVGNLDILLNNLSNYTIDKSDFHLITKLI